jgi:carbon monoxide dehydrogenase subunit G
LAVGEDETRFVAGREAARPVPFICAVAPLAQEHGERRIVVQYETSVTIGRPAEEVFAFISDPSKLATWQSVIQDAQHKSDGPAAEGSEIDVTAQFLGREVQGTAQITEMNPPRSLVAKSDAAPFPVELRYTLTPQDGSTQVTMAVDLEPGRVFSIAGPALKPVLQHQAHADLQALKALMESG